MQERRDTPLKKLSSGKDDDRRKQYLQSCIEPPRDNVAHRHKKQQRSAHRREYQHRSFGVALTSVVSNRRLIINQPLRLKSELGNGGYDQLIGNGFFISDKNTLRRGKTHLDGLHRFNFFQTLLNVSGTGGTAHTGYFEYSFYSHSQILHSFTAYTL